MAVPIAARVLAAAEPGQLVASRTVADLVVARRALSGTEPFLKRRLAYSAYRGRSSQEVPMEILGIVIPPIVIVVVIRVLGQWWSAR
jgi:hypothetical protein